MQREVHAKMPLQDSDRITPKTAKIKLPKLDYGNIGVTGEVIELENFKHMPGTTANFQVSGRPSHTITRNILKRCY